MLDQDNNSYLIHLSILINSLLDSGWILWGEVTCESLLGAKGLIKNTTSKCKTYLDQHYYSFFSISVITLLRPRIFFRIFKAAMRQINSLLRGAREGTKDLLCGCKSAWKSSQNSNKQTTWRQVKLVIYSKAFQISRLSIQQFMLGQIFIFRPLNKISIFA